MTSSSLSSVALTFNDSTIPGQYSYLQASNDVLNTSVLTLYSEQTAGNTVILTGITTPVNSYDAVNKLYVDGLSASGNTWKNTVTLATTVSDMTGSLYTSPSSVSLVGTTIDGHTPSISDRVAVINPAATGDVSGSSLGLYVVSGLSPVSLIRSSDAEYGSISNGSIVYIWNGSTYADQTYTASSTQNPPVVTNWGSTTGLNFVVYIESITVAGSLGQIQYNNGTNDLAASNRLVFTSSSSQLSIGNDSTSSTAELDLGTGSSNTSSALHIGTNSSNTLSSIIMGYNTSTMTSLLTTSTSGTSAEIINTGDLLISSLQTNVESLGTGQELGLYSITGRIAFYQGSTAVMAVNSSNVTLSSGIGLVLTDSTTHTLSLAVPFAITSYTITLPPAVSTGSGYILTSDTMGNTSWTAPGTFSMLALDQYHLYTGNSSNVAIDGGDTLQFDNQTTPGSPVLSLANDSTSTTAVMNIGTGAMVTSSVINFGTTSRINSGSLSIDMTIGSSLKLDGTGNTTVQLATSDTTTSFGVKNNLSGSLLSVLGSGTAIFTGDVYANSFNATSDVSLKGSVSNLDTCGLCCIEKINCYKYQLKDSSKVYYGVMAQELEEIGLGDLVSEIDGHKAVNYLGLIAVLINSVKELSNSVKELQGVRRKV